MYDSKIYSYEENIIDILRQPPPPEPKPPRYVSRYRKTLQPPKEKKAFGAMGLAKLDLKDPQHFMKKGEGVKKPPVKGENICYTGHRPRLPERPTTGMTPRHSVNFIERNIKSAQGLKPKQPDKYLVDCPHGHKYEHDDCKYIFGKYFGNVPQYLVKRNRNIRFAEEAYKNALANKKHLCKALSKDEVNEMLKGLEEKWYTLNSYYTKLPLFIDTYSLVNKKRKIEISLAEIEKHIQFLKENPYIYVYDDD